MKEQLDNLGHTSTKQPSTTKATQASVINKYQLPKLHTSSDTTCQFCFEDFKHHEDVVRTLCRHTFHTTCWEQCIKDGTTTCTACDGELTPIKRWTFVPTTQPQHEPTTEQRPDPSTLGIPRTGYPQQAEPQAYSTASTDQVYPHEYVDNSLLTTPPSHIHRSSFKPRRADAKVTLLFRT